MCNVLESERSFLVSVEHFIFHARKKIWLEPLLLVRERKRCIRENIKRMLLHVLAGKIRGKENLQGQVVSFLTICISLLGSVSKCISLSIYLRHGIFT